LRDSAHQVSQFIKYVAYPGGSLMFRTLTGNALEDAHSSEKGQIVIGQYTEKAPTKTLLFDNDSKRLIPNPSISSDDLGRRMLSVPVQEMFSVTSVSHAQGHICPYKRTSDWVLFRPERFQHHGKLDVEMFFGWVPSSFTVFEYHDIAKELVESKVAIETHISKISLDSVSDYARALEALPPIDLNVSYRFAIDQPRRPYLVVFSCPVERR